ncbi:cell division cycle 23 [Dichotomocladium elegans]|nr:cell division cycle 23 [Dichotomocladium elegans]
MKQTDNIQHFKRDLQQALLVCSERCLYSSSKWAAEILSGIEDSNLDHDPSFTKLEQNLPVTTVTLTDYESSLPPLTEKEYNKYQYAKVLFQMRQYDNVAFVLRGYTAPKLLFLRLYAKYLAGEKRKEEHTQDILGASETSLAENAEISSIYDELHSLYDAKQLDAFGLYLYGMILRKRKFDRLAAAVLLESFMDLQKLLNETMKNSMMKDLFLAKLSLEIHLPSATFWELIQPLASCLPESIYIKSQLATACYDMFEYNRAEALFDEMRKEYPYRLEDMDIYSNLLYLQDSREKLSVLAHDCVRIDRYRPETCCIVANYYSITREIAESVEYFKRALKLDRNYHLAWTLLGHDYIEMKNTNAAIECYRRAINVNSRDYRAWYGLGQAYELLNLPYYATYYYRKATELRPHDARMWKALGACYSVLQEDQDAAGCYARAAECVGEGKNAVLVQLARTYDKMGKKAVAAQHYKRALERYQSEGQHTDEIAEAALYLARDHMGQSEWEEAERYAKIAQDYKYPYYDEAKVLLDEIRRS